MTKDLLNKYILNVIYYNYYAVKWKHLEVVAKWRNFILVLAAFEVWKFQCEWKNLPCPLHKKQDIRSLLPVWHDPGIDTEHNVTLKHKKSTAPGVWLVVTPGRRMKKYVASHLDQVLQTWKRYKQMPQKKLSCFMSYLPYRSSRM